MPKNLFLSVFYMKFIRYLAQPQLNQTDYLVYGKENTCGIQTGFPVPKDELNSTPILVLLHIYEVHTVEVNTSGMVSRWPMYGVIYGKIK